MPEENQSRAGSPAESAEPAGKKAAAVRMMTRGVAEPKASRGTRTKAQRSADAAKPSQKPAAAGSSRKVRRGASKGR
jgi:hypothetical protein